MLRMVTMLALVLAGEAVFALPFHLARFFRPTVLAVFDMSNAQLGAAQGVYGIVAVAAYFFGGPIADRVSARTLLTTSLGSTALGGLAMLQLTNPAWSERNRVLWASGLWGFFGLTTILLFWAALIRATRQWGAHDGQGRAFGLLDAGRGLLAAGLASLGVWLLDASFPDGAAAASAAQRREVLRLIIGGYTAVTALCAAFVWWALAAESVTRPRAAASLRSTLRGVVRAARVRAVWLQALIVLAAYVGYKGFDHYALYAVDAWGVDEVEGAKLATIAAWSRPVAALGAGLVGDRVRPSRAIVAAFGVLLASDLYFAVATPVPGATWVLLGNALVACTAIFGLRGLYFALLEQGRVPTMVTGAAVGLVSTIGFLPDIFVNYVAGRLTDANPGVLGHQHLFAFLAAFAALGLVSAWRFDRTAAGSAS